jgi:hypothetical protein
MRAQQVLQIQSSNYGMAPYNNDDACVWRFTVSFYSEDEWSQVWGTYVDNKNAVNIYYVHAFLEYKLQREKIAESLSAAHALTSQPHSNVLGITWNSRILGSMTKGQLQTIR